MNTSNTLRERGFTMRTLSISSLLPFYLNELAGHAGMWGNTLLFVLAFVVTIVGD